MRVASNWRPRPQLPPVQALPRCRPGEHPGWVSLPPEIDSGRLLARAARLRVGVDPLAASALELALVCDALTRAQVEVAPVLDALAAELHAPRLAPNPELRRWEQSLDGHPTPAFHELPELCLPTRLLNAAGPRLGVLLLDDSRDALALVLERVAARRGRTLEGYALEVALTVAR
jgi:hypothetical protein